MFRTLTILTVILMMINPLFAEDGDHFNVDLVGSVIGGAGTYDIHTSGNYVYVASGSYFRVFNVSNPSSPQEVGVLSNLDGPLGFDIVGSYAYLANEGITIVDISDPTAPTIISDLSVTGEDRRIIVQDNYAYLAGVSCLTIVDVSDPANPSEISSLNIAGEEAYNLAVSGNYVYIITRDEVLVIDVSNPMAPVQVGIGEFTGLTGGADIKGNYIYIAAFNGQWAGVRIMDISDPTNPHEVSYIYTNGGPSDVVIQGDFAYVADYDCGVFVANITDPLNPLQVGYYDSPGDMEDIAVNGDYAYLCGYGDMYIFDCSAATENSPPATFNLTAPEDGSTITEDHVSLSWSESSDDVYKYVVWYATNSQFTENLDSVEVEYNSYNFSDLNDHTTYWWKVRAQNPNSDGTWSSQTWSFTRETSDVNEDPNGIIPQEFAISRAYPNPFNPSLNVEVGLPDRGQLEVSVYNLSGQRVGQLASGTYSAGTYDMTFDAGDLSSGVYFVKASFAGRYTDMRKVVLMK